MQNERKIRICKTPIENAASTTFHGLIFNESLGPNKSRVREIRTLMKLFKNPGSNRCEEGTMETQLSPEELLDAIHERVVVPNLTFSIRMVAGKPNVIAEFFAETTNKNMKARDVIEFIMAHQQLLQTPIKPISRLVRTLHDKLSHETITSDFYDKGRLAG